MSRAEHTKVGILRLENKRFALVCSQSKVVPRISAIGFLTRRNASSVQRHEIGGSRPVAHKRLSRVKLCPLFPGRSGILFRQGRMNLRRGPEYLLVGTRGKGPAAAPRAFALLLNTTEKPMAKRNKTKQHLAKLTAAEQERLEDIGQPWPENFPPTREAPDGSRWADSTLLSAHRASQPASGETR